MSLHIHILTVASIHLSKVNVKCVYLVSVMYLYYFC